MLLTPFNLFPTLGNVNHMILALCLLLALSLSDHTHEWFVIFLLNRAQPNELQSSAVSHLDNLPGVSQHMTKFSLPCRQLNHARRKPITAISALRLHQLDNDYKSRLPSPFIKIALGQHSLSVSTIGGE
jgi:hypothetical protein